MSQEIQIHTHTYKHIGLQSLSSLPPDCSVKVFEQKHGHTLKPFSLLLFLFHLSIPPLSRPVLSSLAVQCPKPVRMTHMADSVTISSTSPTCHHFAATCCDSDAPHSLSPALSLSLDLLPASVVPLLMAHSCRCFSLFLYVHCISLSLSFPFFLCLLSAVSVACLSVRK